MRLHKALRPVALALLIAATAAFSAACGGAKEDKTVIATYKEGTVTQTEFDTFVNTVTFFNPMYLSFKDDPQFRDAMVKQLIGLRLLSAKADEATRKEASEKAKEQIEQLKTMYNAQDAKALENDLKNNNLQESDLQAYIENSLSALMAEEKNVTEDMVKAKYDESLKADPYYFDTATVSHILIGLTDQATGKELRSKEEALKRAEEVIAKLKAGGDFAALAKEYSEDPGSKDVGGTYADENLGQTAWAPAFREAAGKLPVGQISEPPVETSFGYHVMRVDKRTTKAYDEAKEQIRSELAGQKLSEFIEKELPGLITEIKLPVETPAEGGAATGGDAGAGTGTGTGNAPAGDAATEKK
ncbi:peptidylprolyl isomerase [Paenibacillus turpanensis]|uniref:peptidylprolyl isomerase n=1 Tax=Paenibacillus turpanensis TaxID=2689078 RepID=UPI00140ABF8C|nr:peptidylprolyl isomerase [Paenibacillus turpanensis]